MRAFEGQMSERVAIRRTATEKKLILQRLKEEFAQLKPTVADTIRQSMKNRIAELEQQISDGTGSRGKRS